MWLSRQTRRGAQPPQPFEETTAAAAQERVATQEDKTVHPLCPGGFAWRPCVGDRLLVLKDLALGAEQNCPVTLAPGECCLFSRTAYIYLTQDGGIELHGSVTVNGTPVSS